MDYGELMITIPPELLRQTIPPLHDQHDQLRRLRIEEPPRKKRKLLNGVAFNQSNSTSNNVEREPSESSNETEDENVSMHCNEENDFIDGLLEPFIIKIAFTVKEPIDGIHWVVPRDNKDGSPSVSSSVSTQNTSNSPSRASSLAPSSSPPRSRKVSTQRTRVWGAVESEDVEIDYKKSEVLFADRKPRMF